MDMENQGPSTEGQMVREGRDMIISLGDTGTPPPHTHTHRHIPKNKVLSGISQQPKSKLLKKKYSLWTPTLI